MVVIKCSPVSRTSIRSGRGYVRGRVGEVEVGSVESMAKGAVMFVTLCASGVVWGESTNVELTTAVAWGGEATAGGTSSAGASRIVGSLVGAGVGEGGRFDAFGLYFPF